MEFVTCWPCCCLSHLWAGVLPQPGCSCSVVIMPAEKPNRYALCPSSSCLLHVSQCIHQFMMQCIDRVRSWNDWHTTWQCRLSAHDYTHSVLHSKLMSPSTVHTSPCTVDSPTLMLITAHTTLHCRPFPACRLSVPLRAHISAAHTPSHSVARFACHQQRTRLQSLLPAQPDQPVKVQASLASTSY